MTLCFPLSDAISDHGPAATVWETQKAIVIQIPEEGALEPGAHVHPQPRAKDRMLAAADDGTSQARRPRASAAPLATAYTDDILAFMEQVAATVAIAVENGINYDQAQRYQRELPGERDHLRFMLESTTFSSRISTIAGCSRRSLKPSSVVIDADHIGVALYDEESAQLRLDWMYDKARGFTSSDTRAAPG